MREQNDRGTIIAKATYVGTQTRYTHTDMGGDGRKDVLYAHIYSHLFSFLGGTSWGNKKTKGHKDTVFFFVFSRVHRYRYHSFNILTI